MNDKHYSLVAFPKMRPVIFEFSDDETELKRFFDGEIERISIPEDEITLFIDKDANEENAPINRRIVINQTREKEMPYEELKDLFRRTEQEGKHIVGYVQIAAKGSLSGYFKDSLTYAISSDNKAFKEDVGGYSIFASSIDGADFNVRLENYLKAERGGENGWEIERCFVKENVPIIDRLICGNLVVCNTPKEKGGQISDITQEQVDKYYDLFKYYEKSYMTKDNEKSAHKRSERDAR